MESKANYDALLNEYKGNVFEFLVGLEFSRAIGSEKEYLNTSLVHVGDILDQQESFIRRYYPDLIKFLPIWAKELRIIFEKHYTLKNLSSVELVGKTSTALKGEDFSEADILLKGDTEQFPLSIKLAKAGSFVNTKSAGIKSVFTKYLPNLDFKRQTEFNQLYEREFEKFAYLMHKEAGLLCEGGFQNWLNEGLPSLPGQLTDTFREHLLSFYEIINQNLYKEFLNAYELDSEKFVHSLHTLAGFSKPDIIQIIAFHNKSQKSNIDIKLKDLKSRGELQGTRLGSNYFEFIFHDFILQLRLKPMNQFTSSAYKINCSVKFIQ